MNSSLNSILSRESNENQLEEFLYSCVSEKCGHPGPSFQQFLNMGWTEQDFNHTRKTIYSLLSNPTVLYADEAKMPPEFFELPSMVQKKILHCLKAQQESLVDNLLIEMSQKSLPTVIDFDWRLRMVMGSSQVATLREPLLQLDLRLKDCGQERILDLEMSKEELKNFIALLESVK